MSRFKMTWLIMQFIMCVYTATWYDSCVDILDQMVAEETVEQKYTIWIVGFPEDSDANMVANYWYDQSSGNLDMIATFMAEAMFNKDAVWSRWERGICQLYPNKTNNKWINDERRNDIMYQAEVCLDKWNAVPNPSKVWYGWKNREKMKQRIYFFNNEEWK